MIWEQYGGFSPLWGHTIIPGGAAHGGGELLAVDASLPLWAVLSGAREGAVVWSSELMLGTGEEWSTFMLLIVWHIRVASGGL